MAQYDIDLREYWRILKKRKIIVIITAVLLTVFSTIFSIMQAPTPLYTSACSIKFEKETTLEGLYARTLTWSESDDIETQLSIITGFSVLSEVAKSLGLVPQRTEVNDPKMISIVESLKGKIRVTRESFTNILNIMVTDANPAFAQKMANEVAITYKRIHTEQQGKRTTDAIKYIDSQLKDVRGKLKRSEEAFNTFSQVNQLISIDLQSENLLIRQKEINDLIRTISDDQRELENLSIRVEQFIKDPTSSEPNFFSTVASPQYQTANNGLVELILKKDTLLETYTTQHPEVITIELKIIENARKMQLLLKLQIENIKKKKADLMNEIAEVERKTNTLMEKKLEYDRLKREVSSFRDMTALLETKSQEALIRKAEKPEEVVIVKPALLSTFPINPPKYLTTGAMGLIIGIVLGLVFAFLIETFDTSLGAIDDVEETLGAKVLGVIPIAEPKEIINLIRDKYPKKMDDDSISTIINLITHFAPKTMISESFRALRTNIHFRDGDSQLKTIAVTSTSPKEGKSLISSNLSISLAQAGLRTLLIGADLRKPRLAEIFGLEENPGLTDIVLGSYPWMDTVKTITDLIMGKITMDEVMMTPGLDNLHIITSGTIPPNPAELIESKRLMTFIEEAKKEYDILIFDSTPVLSTADAAILGTKVDGVLLVYRVGTVSRGLLKRSANQLSQVNCNLTGVILNGMKPDISPDFQDYKYYSYYSYYSHEGEEESGPRRIWPFSLFGGKKKDQGFIAAESLPSNIGLKEQKSEKKDSSTFLKVFLLIAALLTLGVGLLWQNGILDLSFTKPSESMQQSSTPPSEVVIDKPLELSPNTGVKAEYTPEEDTPKGIPHEEAEIAKPVVTKNDAKRIESDGVSYQPGNYPFSIYLGSFQTMERARLAVREFAQKGISPYFVKVTLKGKEEWFRIYTGHFANSDEAQGYINDHGLTNAEIKKTAYANIIDNYRDSNDLETIRQSLLKLGYSPYIIRDRENRSILFVGAFITESGAEEQNRELRSNGINSRLVQR